MISNKLDAAMLNLITRCVSEHYADRGKAQQQSKRFCWLLSLLILICDPLMLSVFCSEAVACQKKKKKNFFTVRRLEINISKNSLKSDWIWLNERRHFDFCLWISLCTWRNMWVIVWRNGKLWHLHFCFLKGLLQINIGFIDGVKYVREGRKQMSVTDLGKIKIQKHLALN